METQAFARLRVPSSFVYIHVSSIKIHVPTPMYLYGYMKLSLAMYLSVTELIL